MTLDHAFSELMRRKARTVATVLGYAIAVSSMTVLVGVLRTSGERSAEILDHTGTHFVVYSPAGPGACGPCAPDPDAVQTGGQGFVALGSASNLMPVSFADKISGLPSVRAASPYLSYTFRDPRDNHPFTVGGFHLSDSTAVGGTSCAATDVIQGRFLSEGDTGKVMLEEAYAKLRRLSAGDTVHVAARDFSVVGVVNPGIRPAKADIYMPYAEAQAVIASQIPNVPLSNQANMVLVEAKDSSTQDQAIQQVKALYPDLIVSTYACYKPAAQAKAIDTGAIAILMAVIGFFTVLVCMISQLSVLVERRRELGILKTMGYSDARIAGQITLESVTQAVAGALLAVPTALLLMPRILSKLPGAASAATAVPSWPAICATAVALAAAGGLLAGVFPALWAGRKRPADLLRSL